MKNIKTSIAICYITIGKNNLIFNLTDLLGNQIIWLRPVFLKFKTRKQRFNTFAMEQTVLRLVRQLILLKIKKIRIVFSGFFKVWMGKAIVKAFSKKKILINSCKYRIARPHGLMRPKKSRRL